MNLDLTSVTIIVLIIIAVYFTYEKVSNSDIDTEQEYFENSKLVQNNIESHANPQKSVKKLKSAMKKHKKGQKKKKKKVKFNVPLKNTKNKNFNDFEDDLVFFDIGTDNKYYGKIIIRLFSNIVPRTCENFRVLCKTKKYYNSPFHRIIKDFMIQGGDYTNGNGTGGMSIYGSKFPDENFKLNHDKKYLLSMANSGPNTNGSQFFITTNETAHLDGKHVVFGEIQSGFDVVDDLNEVRTDHNDRPIENIKVLNCGIFN